jgi:selenide,water dikinase
MHATGRLLLVGAGQAHLFVLEALARGRLRAAETTLVAPHGAQVSPGLVPGFLEGRYQIDQVTIDLAQLARASGVQFRRGMVERIEPGRRRVMLDDATFLPFDVASFAIGGVPAGASLPGVRVNARFIRPLDRLIELRAALDRAAATAGPEPLQAVVVGAGAVGVEVALAIRARLDRLGTTRAIIQLLDSTGSLFRERNPPAEAEADRALRRAEIVLRLSTGVEEVGPAHLRLSGGRVLPADIIVWTPAVEAWPIFRASGLPVDTRGFLEVDDTLAVRGVPGLYGAGEAVALADHPRAQLDRSPAARQGRVLAGNLGLALSAAGRGGPAPRPHHFQTPPTRALALLDTGDGRAIVSYGGFATTAGWARSLKDRLDRRYLHRFLRLTSGTAPPPAS